MVARKRTRTRSKKKIRSRDRKKSRARSKKRTRSRSRKRTRTRSRKRTRTRSKKRTRSRKRTRTRSRKRTRTRSKKRTRSRDRKIKVTTRKSPAKILVNKKPVYSKKSCPKGSISRKSYIRKGNVKVHAACVKSKSLRAKKKKPAVYLPPLKLGSLKKYGYSVHDSIKKRHTALKKAIKKYGSSSTIKKLNAIRLLTKNTSPKNSKIYEKDLRYVQKTSS
jgi:hypothetical protein